MSAAAESLSVPEQAWYSDWLEKDWVPDWLIRSQIRRLLKQRLADEDAGSDEANAAKLARFVGELRRSPIAIRMDAANAQHYEVPAAFYEIALGKRRKYSCALYENGASSLDQAEEAMLELTSQRARLADGHRILELGCGWGSLTLYMAERFPNSRITGVSNSNSQREFIVAEASRRGLTNVEIRTADMNDFEAETAEYDRIVSVEMFEHMRNYEALLAKIARWSKPGALLFVHIFTHHKFAYPFEVKDASDWMAQHFFTGGVMPSDGLLLEFQREFAIREHWQVNGTHYGRTAENWLRNMDRNRQETLSLFSEVYGKQEALKWLIRWRIFFLSCAELWNYREGNEWLVSHYLFELV